MRAVRGLDHHGPEGVTVEDVPVPRARDAEVVVEVHAVAASFPDLLMSQGRYHLQPPAPFTLGSDFAGIVTRSPDGCHVSVGDRVAGFLDFGAACEVVTAPVGQVYPLPDCMSMSEGAALPMNYLTAHFTLTTRGGLQAGDTVLVHGAAGGVGIACLQVARGLGAETIAVVSSDEKEAVALRAGATHAIRREDVPRLPKELTGGRGVDIVVDVVGGEVMTDSLRSLAPLGRVMVVGFASGDIPTVKVNRLLMNNVDVRGVEQSYMVDQGRSLEQWEQLVPLMESGTIAPVLHTVRPFEEFRDGLVDMAQRRLLGRAVFTTGIGQEPVRS
ncbi:NADPH:quinone oxidoreductase family protein [Nocardioides hungaricus]